MCVMLIRVPFCLLFGGFAVKFLVVAIRITSTPSSGSPDLVLLVDATDIGLLFNSEKYRESQRTQSSSRVLWIKGKGCKM